MNCLLKRLYFQVLPGVQDQYRRDTASGAAPPKWQDTISPSQAKYIAIKYPHRTPRFIHARWYHRNVVKIRLLKAFKSILRQDRKQW